MKRPLNRPQVRAVRGAFCVVLPLIFAFSEAIRGSQLFPFSEATPIRKCDGIHSLDGLLQVLATAAGPVVGEYVYLADS